MTNNWDEPALTESYSNILNKIKARDEAIAKMDFSGDSNIKNGFIRANASNDDKLERYNSTTTTYAPLAFHDEIDSHIADTSIHEAFLIGEIKMCAFSSAPTGWLLCDGSAVSRTTYAALFAKLGTAYGSGDGSTTFNLPDFRGYSPIGVDTGISYINALGKSYGTFNHTHTVGNHTHTISDHTHDMSNHTHTAPAHTHSIPAHTHSVPAHYHATTGNGADINITSSGSHTHDAYGKEGGSNGSDADRPQGAASSSGTNVTWSDIARPNGSSHVHGNASFAGRVGNVSSGVNGDSAMTTGSGGSGTSGSGGNSATSAPSTNTTGGSGTLTTSSSGAATTDAGQSPVLTCYFFIKY